MRSGVVVMLVLGVLAAAWLARGAAGAAACTVTDGDGAVLLSGPPGRVAAALEQPEELIADSLGAGPAVSCRIAAVPVTADPKEPPRGLTPRAAALRREVRATFGAVPDGGYGPQETLPGRRPGGEHSLGRAIDFFFRPHEDPEQAERGWRLANWAVANAERLGIRTVIYRDRIWTARRSAQGWREYRFRGSDPDNPINRHLDHVHVDVG